MRQFAILVLAAIVCNAVDALTAESSSRITDILSPAEKQRWLSALNNIKEEVSKHDKEVIEAENEAAEKAAVMKALNPAKPAMKMTLNKTNVASEYFSAMFGRLAETQKQYAAADLMLFGFSYDDCSGPSDPVHLRALHVSPDPIPIPGRLVVDASAEVGESIAGNLKASVKLETEIFGHFFEIPCVDKVGSCDYDDLCSDLPKPEEPCPPAFVKAGIPCRCPFPAGKFNLPTSAIDLPSVPLPIKSATIRLTAHLTADGKPVTCIQLTAKVQKMD